MQRPGFVDRSVTNEGQRLEAESFQKNAGSNANQRSFAGGGGFNKSANGVESTGGVRRDGVQGAAPRSYSYYKTWALKVAVVTHTTTEETAESLEAAETFLVLAVHVCFRLM